MTVHEAQARVAEIRSRIGLGAPVTAGGGDAFAATLQSTMDASRTSLDPLRPAAASSTAQHLAGTALASSALASSALASSALASSALASSALAGTGLAGTGLARGALAGGVAAAGGVLGAGALSAGSMVAALRPAGLTGVPYAHLFQQAGAKYGLAPALLAAVAKVESGYNPTAVSGAGAQGLMQLMPATARGLGVDALDPAQAVDGAARMLSSNLHRFGTLDLALAAYNAGGGAVSRYGGIPPFAETQAYVPKVKAAMEQLAGRGVA